MCRSLVKYLVYGLKVLSYFPWTMRIFRVLGKHSELFFTHRSFSYSAQSAPIRRPLKSKWDARAHIDHIRNICESNNFEAIRNALKEMQSDGFRLTPAFTILINAYGRSGLFEDAALVLHQMKSFNCHPDVATYRCLVDVLAKGRCHQKLLDIQHNMFQDEVVPDTTTGKNLLLNLSMSGRIPECRSLHHRLKELGCQIPEDFLIQICGANRIQIGGNFAQTAETLTQAGETLTHVEPITYIREFRSLIDDISMDKTNCKALKALDSMLATCSLLDSATCMAVVDGLCKLNKLGRAKLVLSQMRERGAVPEALLYDIVMNCVVKEGKLGDVETLWGEIRGDGNSGCFNYVKFVTCLCRKGEVGEAVKVFQRVTEAGWGLDGESYGAFIGGLCKVGEGDIAKEVIPRMKREGFFPDMIIYIALLQCFCRAGNIYEADIILRKMIRRNYEPDISVYASFISGLCKTGKFREANKLFRKIIRKDYVVRVPSVKRGKRAIFQLNVSGAIPGDVAYGIFIRSLCSTGKFKEAGALLKEMMQEGWAPDVCVFNSFIEGLCVAGKIDEARKFYNIIIEKRLVSHTDSAVSLIHGLCKVGRSDEAMELFDTLINSGFVPTASICNTLVVGHWKAGNVDTAKKMFERMLDGSCGRPDICTYNIMFYRLCNNGEVAEACSLFQMIKNRKGFVNDVSYSTIFRGLCNAGDLVAAHRLLNEMLETGYVFTFNRWKFFFNAMYEEKASDCTDQ